MKGNTFHEHDLEGMPFHFHSDYTDVEMILPENVPPLTVEWIDERLKEFVVEYLKPDTTKSAPQR